MPFWGPKTTPWVPRIRVTGRWLEASGFHQGRPVELQAEPGQIVISLADDAEP